MPRYPHENSWPVEGFPMDKSEFVQIRLLQFVHGSPPRKGYPSEHPGGAYVWYEVHLCFRPYAPGQNVSGNYIEVYNKSGRKLKPCWKSQCIARFDDRDEARLFIHKMHQSRHLQKRVFFNDFDEEAK